MKQLINRYVSNANWISNDYRIMYRNDILYLQSEGFTDLLIIYENMSKPVFGGILFMKQNNS